MLWNVKSPTLPLWMPPVAALPKQSKNKGDCCPTAAATGVQCVEASLGLPAVLLSFKFIVLMAQTRWGTKGNAVGVDIASECLRTFGTCSDALCPTTATKITDQAVEDARQHRARTYVQQSAVNSHGKAASLIESEPGFVLLNDNGHAKTLLWDQPRAQWIEIDPFDYWLKPRIITLTPGQADGKFRRTGVGDMSVVLGRVGV